VEITLIGGFLRLKLLLRFAIRPAHERLLAIGKIRGYDVFQTDYVDIGIIVTESERGKSLATQVLRQLADMNETNGLKSICSTEKGNIGALKAISRTGFFASNRIFQFHV
jgi:predicted acetyltransferase